ncbi:MAG: heme exporter protein CcmB [Rhodocyclaceae bacterium]|nr:heme exporter protein CcmB [Rhodocyclaceae bacterium]MCA3026255.1 heme exporter protein CcmB [Rhodocyclaceae bacterium]MCA3032085.1 heme exporter protein CcmB [Rhodocyclaceae bacterium]MCA3038190.1 heme exporter protein CcmB [Rhodocyclaceae bacterium]MCA3039040.1 heme exporter protein CcmB [Rhodocyclaceae bacterium]
MWLTLTRDIKLAMRSKGELAQALAFFIIVVSLFPLAIGPESAVLKRIAAGVVWVCALLAVMLTLPRLFQSDYVDGTLEQLALSPYPLPLLCAGKMLAHWLSTGLPLAMVAPVLGLQFGLDASELLVMVAGLLIGTPVLTMLGAIGAALVLGVRGGSILMALLVLPLYIPVLIFGAGAVEASLAGVDAMANLSLLAAMLLFGLVTTPFAAAAAVKISLD